VDGVVLIGEHGDYPRNEKGQKLYPRYELYRQVIEVFQDTGQTVPVFCDKHLSTEWSKALWMVDQSRHLGFPLLTGYVQTMSWRRPPLELALSTPVEKAIAYFHGPKEDYGIHALEILQCMVERRAGGETGIDAVWCLEGPAVWDWTDARPAAACPHSLRHLQARFAPGQLRGSRGSMNLCRRSSTLSLYVPSATTAARHTTSKR
jgi:hypothetical protein